MLGRGPGGASLLPLTLLVNRGIILQASAVCEDTQHYSYSPWLPFIAGELPPPRNPPLVWAWGHV